jgi:hypothetical protein
MGSKLNPMICEPLDAITASTEELLAYIQENRVPNHAFSGEARSSCT